MPDSRPYSPFFDPRQDSRQYDNPPATEASTPRTRRERLGRALQDTSELAREHESERRARPSLLSPIGRRRRRSPSNNTDELAGVSATEQSSRHRPKRRRLAPTEPSEKKQPIAYGRYGQVEPGRLRLELVSCDGGVHIDPRHPGQFLGARNILQHDKSVYCSERSSSNIILRHADDTPFCLEKLHIVGPEHGFTAPVREGLVYVGMTLNDLQKYTDPPPWARRNGVHSPALQSTSRRRQQLPPAPRRTYLDSLRSSPERLTLSDALRDSEVNAALEARERGQTLEAEAARDATSFESDYYGEDFGFGRTDPEAHCDIPVVSSTDGPDTVMTPEGDRLPVTILSDEEVGPEDNSTQEVLDFRLQRLRLMRRRFELPWSGQDDSWEGINGLRFDAHHGSESSSDTLTREATDTLSRLNALMSRSRMRDTPSNWRLSPPPPPSSGDHYLQTAGSTSRDVPSDVNNEALERSKSTELAADDPNVQAASFAIKKGKHKVAVRFDPPISGRFILLKLWAGRGNVDVQSIIAKGFGGPRFFLARELA
ncbi:hypothetical protein D0859_06469 [Hortaea werneckii]|uniref:Uncharacterized protein n=1 Tax=Hortaea werneckii TaxID=91943 RepID=A0A3M7IVR4_HORWE|nr:hypothetical protein D0859_06469 [Hortaea werneckii]